MLNNVPCLVSEFYCSALYDQVFVSSDDRISRLSKAGVILIGSNITAVFVTSMRHSTFLQNVINT